MKKKPEPRKLKEPSYRSFRLSKRIKNKKPKIPSAWMLLRMSISTVLKHWRFFGGVALIYGLLFFIFVRGISGGLDVSNTKTLINDALGDFTNNFITSFAIFAGLVAGTSARGNSISSVYQGVIVLICSLALIWGLRQVYTRGAKTIRVKQGFYEGMYPLVPFLLVLLVIVIELIPMTVAGVIYTTAVIGGIAVTGVEQFVLTLTAICLTLLSLYMVTSSIFALYIVTLPGVKPLKALRSARKLVVHRRAIILRKMLWLVLVLMVVLGVLVLPFIIYVPIFGEFAFFAVNALLLPISHTYIYNLYRSLL